MPYIKQERRDSLSPGNESDHAQVSGELNYQITMLIKQYWDNHGPAYQTINDIVGALSASQAEFYRRVAVPYENTKILENEDVYTP